MKIMKTTILLLAFALFGSSSTLPGLGTQVLAIPGTTWSVGFSDQLGGADTDFGAAVATISFDTAGDSATLEYATTDSSDLDFLRVAIILGDDGAWILPGQTETFALPSSTVINYPWPNYPIVFVELLDATYPYPQLSTGDGDLNPDGFPHAEVTETVLPPTATPEPSGLVLMLFGLGLGVAGKLLRKS